MTGLGLWNGTVLLPEQHAESDVRGRSPDAEPVERDAMRRGVAGASVVFSCFFFPGGNGRRRRALRRTSGIGVRS